MTIRPLGNNIQLKIEEVQAGVLDTSSRDTVVEYAQVVAIGDSVPAFNVLKTGDYVFVKAWAIDSINYQDQKYYFCNLDTGGVLAVVRQ